MRFKYYLRGIGIGVTLATLLLTVSFYFGRDKLTKQQLSDEEIIQRATALGMVMPEEEISADSAVDEVVADDVATEESPAEELAPDAASEEIPADAPAEETIPDAQVPVAAESTEDETVTYVPFTVRGGESSEVISSHLKKAGLIDDADAFNKYLYKCNVDDRIPNGTFYVKQGSSYDDIVAVLVNKDVRTTTPPKN